MRVTVGQSDTPATEAWIYSDCIKKLGLLILQKPLGVDGRHAAGTGGGDRLAVDVILHVAAGKHARDISPGPVVGEDITARV